MFEGIAYDLFMNESRSELLIVALGFLFVIMTILRLMSKMNNNAATQYKTENLMQSELIKLQQSHATALHALTRAIDMQTTQLEEQSKRLANALVDLIDKTDSTEGNILKPVVALTEQVREIGEGVARMASDNNDNIDKLAGRIGDIDKSHMDAVANLETRITAKHNATHKSIAELLTELRSVRDSVVQIHTESDNRFKDVMESLDMVQASVQNTITASVAESVSITKPIGNMDLVAKQLEKQGNNDKDNDNEENEENE